MSAWISLTGENIASNTRWPIEVTLPRYTHRVVGVIWPAAADRPMRFFYRTTHQFGDSGARHDSSVMYRLPFEDGQSFFVSQAFGGRLTTHNDGETQYAVDFSMPEGTVVVAARAGIVVDVTIGNFAGAADVRLLDKANSVTVLHEDGTVAQYAHLAQRPALVSRGQRVAPGDRLGYSGNTGYSSGPHLHFAVSKPVMSQSGAMTQASLPITFFVKDPPKPIVLAQGMVVTAAYNKGGSSIAARKGFIPQALEEPRIVSRTARTPYGEDIDTKGWPVPATMENQTLLRQDPILERTGIPGLVWVGALLLLWLWVRMIRKDEVAKDPLVRIEPSIGNSFDSSPDSDGRR